MGQLLKSLEYKKRSRREDFASSSDFLTSYNNFGRERDTPLLLKIPIHHLVGQLAGLVIQSLFHGGLYCLAAAVDHALGQGFQQIAAAVQKFGKTLLFIVCPQTVPLGLFVILHGGLFRVIGWDGVFQIGSMERKQLFFLFKLLKNLCDFNEHRFFLLHGSCLNVYFQVPAAVDVPCPEVLFILNYYTFGCGTSAADLHKILPENELAFRCTASGVNDQLVAAEV